MDVTPEIVDSIYFMLKNMIDEKEIKHKCTACGCPIHIDWDDCPVCGSTDATDM